jgi:hypothetical protein
MTQDIVVVDDCCKEKDFASYVWLWISVKLPLLGG